VSIPRVFAPAFSEKVVPVPAGTREDLKFLLAAN